MRLIAAISLALSLACASSQPRVVSAPAVETSYQRVIASTDIDGAVVGEPKADVQATLVVFFASWCSHCRHELAILGELRRDDPSLRIVGINAYEEWSEMSDEQRMRAYLAENAPWLQVVRGDGGMMKAFGGVRKIPAMFLFDKSGALAQAFRRGKRAPPTREEIASAVAAAKSRPQAKR